MYVFAILRSIKLDNKKLGALSIIKAVELALPDLREITITLFTKLILSLISSFIFVILFSENNLKITCEIKPQNPL